MKMELCRLCNIEVNRKSSANIFHKAFHPPLWKIIAELSNLTILENDPYTKIICFQCFVQLQKFHLFRKKILYTDLKIRHNVHNKYKHNDNNIQQLPGGITTNNLNVNDHHGAPIQVDEDDCIVEEKIEVAEDPLKIDETQHISDNFDKSTRKDNENYGNGNEELEQSLQDVKWNSNDLHSDSSLNQTENDQYILTEVKIKIEQDPLNENEIDNSNKPTCKDDKGVIIVHQNDETITNSMGTVEDSECGKTGRYQCDKCNKTYSNEKSLKAHLRLYTDDKQHQCNICYKIFQARCVYREHVKVHKSNDSNTRRPNKGCYDCSVCGKTFLYNSQLIPHLRGHTGMKPFKCKICNARFASKYSLQQHLKVHC